MDTSVSVSVSTHDFLKSSRDTGRFGTEELCTVLARYMNKADIQIIRDACMFATNAHAGQKPFIG